MWWFMATLATLISFYAFAFFFVDELGSDLKTKFSTMPLAAWAHIWGGGVALLTGAFQMNAGLRRRKPVVHRVLGTIYLSGILAGGLGGVYLAWHAEGGVMNTLGFGALGVLWLVTGMMAWLSIRSGQISNHRKWMIRNYALTFAGVTLRIYLPLSMMAGLTFPVAYAIIAWMCWAPNLIVAEWLFIRRTARRSIRRVEKTVPVES